MSRLALTLVAVAATLLACGKSRDQAGGLPPADDWQAPPLAAGGATGATGSAGAATASDPHAGLDMGGGGGDPHAGLDMGGAEADPAMAGLKPPDPSRAIDSSRYLRGQISASAATASTIKPGAILFLSVKPVDPTTGDVVGGTIAVDRLDVAALPIAFELTEAQAMVEGTRFTGAVVITARIDGDGEARTREPGDVEGSVRATIPADQLALVLDQLVP